MLIPQYCRLRDKKQPQEVLFAPKKKR